LLDKIKIGDKVPLCCRERHGCFSRDANAACTENLVT
jgi:hypothetical protein